MRKAEVVDHVEDRGAGCGGDGVCRLGGDRVLGPAVVNITLQQLTLRCPPECTGITVRPATECAAVPVTVWRLDWIWLRLAIRGKPTAPATAPREPDGGKMNYDIIGDIHGQVEKLRALLQRLGYRERIGTWQHPDRTAIFVGDFIDRGPHQLETVSLVRRMVDGGHALAVMGNHEFNAIAWYLKDPVQEGEYLRPHWGEVGSKNRQQHAAFLAEAEDTPKHREAVNWFLTLPLWLDLPELRVIHACWHAAYMADLEPLLRPGNRLDDALVAAASRKGTAEYRAVEGLLKGAEIPLPKGSSFFDKDGVERHEARLRWWDAAAVTYRAAAIVPPESRGHLTDDPIPDDARVGYAADKPVFFGHYWLTGVPGPLASRVACVDYSAGKKDEPLVAYRYDGETELDASKFVSSH